MPSAEQKERWASYFRRRPYNTTDLKCHCGRLALRHVRGRGFCRRHTEDAKKAAVDAQRGSQWA